MFRALTPQDNMQPSVQSPKESKSVRSVRVVQVDTPDQVNTYSNLPLLP